MRFHRLPPPVADGTTVIDHSCPADDRCGGFDIRSIGCGHQALHGLVPGMEGKVKGAPMDRVQEVAFQIQVRLYRLLGWALSELESAGERD